MSYGWKRYDIKLGEYMLSEIRRVWEGWWGRYDHSSLYTCIKSSKIKKNLKKKIPTTITIAVTKRFIANWRNNWLSALECHFLRNIYWLVIPWFLFCLGMAKPMEFLWASSWLLRLFSEKRGEKEGVLWTKNRTNILQGVWYHCKRLCTFPGSVGVPN